MLDFRTETFLTICEYMNYTKAAEVLNITQPAASGHIKYLENYYQVKLFSYEKKKLTLTKQGERLKRALQTIYHDELKLKTELAQLSEARIYRIGATLSIGNFYLPPFLVQYLAGHKDIELSVTVANTERLLKMLDQGQLDIVLTEGFFQKEEYESRLLKEEPLSIFCGKDYDMGPVKTIEDLFAHPFISREHGSGTRAVFENYLFEKGYSLENFKSKSYFNSMDLITEMLAANQGISVLYKCVGRKLLDSNRIREVELDGFHLAHDFNALWQKNGMYGSENDIFLEELFRWQKENDY